MRLLRRSVRRKRRGELAYWAERAAEEGGLATGAWYAHAYTDAFGLEPAWYAGKRVLDIGCGPRGSLEWAAMAARRVGLDPLAAEYARLPRDRPHAMEYVTGRSEAMPFAEASFDVVSSFNALDHVEDLGAAAREIVRVLAPGGTLLLLVMVRHVATELEPHELDWDCTTLFAPPLRLEDERRYADTRDGDLYGGIADARPYEGTGVGLLAARFSASATPRR